MEATLDFVHRSSKRKPILAFLESNPREAVLLERSLLRRLMTHVLADVACLLLEPGAGVTLSLLTAESINPTTGYAVSLHGHERRVSGLTTREQWAGYVADHWDVLNQKHMLGGHEDAFVPHLGAFHCNHAKMTFMDVSVLIADRTEAVRVGVDQRQRCIYDFERRCVIELDHSAVFSGLEST